ncbi:MAG: molybdenum cofactor guanylyltransferase [Acidobacteriota bacterium]
MPSAEPPGSIEPPGGSVVGVALAGGQSRRMGRDKTVLVVPGDPRTLLRSTVDRLAEVCSEVLVADGGRRRLGDVPSVVDGPGRGPIAGVLGAAAARPGRDLLVLACDLPAVPRALLRLLVEARDHGAARVDAVVPVTERGLEPLCARYAPRCLDAFRARVAEGRFDLIGLLNAPPSPLRVERVERPNGELINLNRPTDVETFAAMRHSILRR